MTGGGHQPGQGRRAELARCGASVLDRRAAPGGAGQAAAELGTGAPGSPATSGAATAPRRSSARRSSGTGGWTSCSTTPAASTSCRPRASPPRAGARSSGSTSAARWRCARRPTSWPCAPAGGTIVNVTVSPHHGMPAMAHTGAARAAVEALTQELAAQWAGDGVAVSAVALGRFATESLSKYPAELWRRPPRRCRSSAWARWRSTAGWWRCWPRRWGGRSPARWSRSTARSTTGPGPGRPRTSCADGEVPTEERPAPPLAGGYARNARRGRCPDSTAPRYHRSARGRSVVVAQKPSKLLGRVRFPSPALLSRPVIIGASHGEWRSLVAHPAGGRAVAGSNPVSPI